MLVDCDYIRDKQNRFYIVKGYYNNDKVLANLVFIPSKNGRRYNTELKQYYNKVIEQNHIPVEVDRDNISAIYKPTKKLRQSYDKFKGTIWENIIDNLVKLGIPRKDIGIFGSYLIGFDIVKDVDFLIQGKKNCIKLKQLMPQLFKLTNLTPITNEHIAYQIKTHGRFYSKFNNFEKMLKNKWSSLQIAKGILSTIRFVYKSKEVPPNPFSSPIKKPIIVKGKVIEDIGTNFCPRTFKIHSKDQEYKIATYFWIYQAAVKVGQIVKVKGLLHTNNQTVSLSKFSHGIRVIK